MYIEYSSWIFLAAQLRRPRFSFFPLMDLAAHIGGLLMGVGERSLRMFGESFFLVGGFHGDLIGILDINVDLMVI